MSLNGAVVGPVTVDARANQCDVLSDEVVVCLVLLQSCVNMVEGCLRKCTNLSPKLCLVSMAHLWGIFGEPILGIEWVSIHLSRL
ncbi:hypothetical protein GIB67_026418 [Kingdonia uniflora]|uniref:Uncharacterized protein n=1 Tax=Kingdonia uniflora TaxID=39325 RepID=A0A7J7P6F8_9MAGN|nr:hypothetical protein GIB67_026418 [Kingdonia uniflora]